MTTPGLWQRLTNRRHTRLPSDDSAKSASLLGAYITFTINAPATLRALNDPLATACASSLPKRRYAACIIATPYSAIPARCSTVTYDGHTCLLLCNGVPVPCRIPAERAPGMAEPSLPWAAAGFHAHVDAAVYLRLAPRALMLHGDAPRLHPDDVAHAWAGLEEDAGRGTGPAAQHNFKAAAHPSYQSLASAASSASSSSSALSSVASMSTESPSVYSIVSDGGVLGGSPGLVFHDDALDDAKGWEHHLVPVVDYSVDESDVPECVDGRLFFEDLAMLKQIRRESERRSRQRRARRERETQLTEYTCDDEENGTDTFVGSDVSTSGKAPKKPRLRSLLARIISAITLGCVEVSRLRHVCSLTPSAVSLVSSYDDGTEEFACCAAEKQRRYEARQYTYYSPVTYSSAPSLISQWSPAI
ncbi:hypothetical protein FA95DRAFT_1136917 [Auriscalpium vulgare]|uniref:Uncharacterized protein n=1 Tax=Auriscalpium vulgare TaxID=40419 RepID=A0ACB8R434_9AGAM|nr:hypothetical protein FA95DRAFT_1136917 [Auriscalpium vulgare]